MSQVRYLKADFYGRPAVFAVRAKSTTVLTDAQVRDRGYLIAAKVDGVWSLHGLVEVRDERYIEILEATPRAGDAA